MVLSLPLAVRSARLGMFLPALGVLVLALGLVALTPERSSAETRTVALDGSGDYSSIQQALDDSGHGDVIEVGPGIYRESLFFGGRRVQIVSTEGAEETTIHPPSGCAALFIFGETRDAGLRGFTLRGGTGRPLTEPIVGAEGSEATAPGLVYGGAIICNASSPTLEDLIFENNTANVGGALFTYGGAPFIKSCTFRDNLAGQGGAIAMIQGGTIMRECVIEDNFAAKGGAIYCETSGLDCHAAQMKRNRAGEGGAVFMFSNEGWATAIHHTVFYDNVAEEGGAIRVVFGNLDLRYCVVSQNGTPAFAPAEAYYTKSTGTLHRNIFFPRGDAEALLCDFGGSVDVFCNIFWPGPVPETCGLGADNLSIDPRFCNAKTGDFQYRYDSPCLEENSPTECGAIGPYIDANCPKFSSEVSADAETESPGLPNRSGTAPERTESEAERIERGERNAETLRQVKRERYQSQP